MGSQQRLPIDVVDAPYARARYVRACALLRARKLARARVCPRLGSTPVRSTRVGARRPRANTMPFFAPFEIVDYYCGVARGRYGMWVCAFGTIGTPFPVEFCLV